MPSKENIVLDTLPLPIIWRGEPDYERARVGRIFNKKRPARFPVAILEATTISHVVRGMRLAKDRGLKVAIRSGGHSWAAWSVRHEALLIDLGGLKELSFDVNTDLVTAAPATTGGELNPFLSRYGRFFAGGHCPTVGIGGFLLQGGQGWAARGWGWSAEQIQSIDVVLPSGELVTASEKGEHKDLFWAARGGGPGFFGVVVRFRLHTRGWPLAPHHTTIIMPAKDNFKDVMIWLQQAAPQAAANVEIVSLAFTRGRLFPQDIKEGDDPLETMLVIRATALSDSSKEATQTLKFMSSCPKMENAIVKAIIVPTTMPEEYAQQLADNPEGRYFNDNAWVVDGPPEVIADSLDLAFTTLPSLHSFFLYYSMAPLRQMPDMAFDIQTEHYVAGYIIATDDKEDSKEDERCSKWLDERFGYIASKGENAGGTIGQYSGDSDWVRRRSNVMSDKNYEKFVKIRSKYDPKETLCGFLTAEEHSAAVNPPAGSEVEGHTETGRALY